MILYCLEQYNRTTEYCSYCLLSYTAYKMYYSNTYCWTHWMSSFLQSRGKIMWRFIDTLQNIIKVISSSSNDISYNKSMSEVIEPFSEIGRRIISDRFRICKYFCCMSQLCV